MFSTSLDSQKCLSQKRNHLAHHHKAPAITKAQCKEYLSLMFQPNIVIAFYLNVNKNFILFSWYVLQKQITSRI